MFLVGVAMVRWWSCLQALSVKPGRIQFQKSLVLDPAFLAKNKTLDFLLGNLFIPEIAMASSASEDRK